MINLSADLDVIRRCMLRGSITADLDAIVTVNPVARCMVIAKALHVASSFSHEMEMLVSENGLISSLRDEAMRRKTGNMHQPALIASNKQKYEKESNNV